MSKPWGHDIDIKPGSLVSYKFGDQVWTARVDSVTHSTQPYVAARKLPRLERIVRRLTPKRRRKPLPQPSGGLPVVTITTADPIWTRGAP